MKNIYAVISVDEDAIMKECKGTGADYLEEAINQELGWLHDSGMTVDSWSFDEPKTAEISVPDELIVRLAHYAGEMEAKGLISAPEWDDLCKAVQDAIKEYYDSPSETNPFHIEDVAEKVFAERFPPVRELQSFYYTFGTSDSFPFKYGWVEVQAKDRKQADSLFRENFPDRTPGILNCSSIYDKETFERVRESIKDHPRWNVCHQIISAGEQQNDRTSSLNEKIQKAEGKKGKTRHQLKHIDKETER